MPYENALVDIDDTVVCGLADYHVGIGYDRLKANPRFNALAAPEPKEAGTTKQESNVWVAVSAQDIAKNMDLGVDMRAAYLGAEVAVAASLVRAFEASETSITIVASLWERVDSLTLEGQSLDLSEEAAAALAEGTDRFHTKYGGYYCHTIHRGGRLYVAYNVKLTTRKATEDMALSIEAKFKDLASLAAGLKTHLEESGQSYEWQIHIEKIGAGGPLPDWDKSDPEEASKMIKEYLNGFIADIEANPQPFDGHYRGYWIPFSNMDGLRQQVIAANDKAEALGAWAEDYVDVMAAARGILDPKSREGYAVDSASRTSLETALAQAGADLRAIQDAYGKMLHFDDFQTPETLKEAGVLKHSPGELSTTVEAIRTQVKTQICYGMKVHATFPNSSWNVGKSSDSMPSDAEEDTNESWPWVRVDKSTAQAYTIISATKKNGEPVRHGDKVRFQSTESGETNKQIYMPSSGYYVKLATFEGKEDYKYTWIVDISGGKKDQILTSAVTSKIKNDGDPKWFWCPWKEYLAETSDAKNDWHVKISRA